MLAFQATEAGEEMNGNSDAEGSESFADRKGSYR
jgi:hypothetical protein